MIINLVPRKYYVYGTILGAGIAAILFSSILPVWLQNKNMRQQIRDLRKQVQSLERQVSHFQNEITAIKTNPTYIEFLLRNKLHYRRKGDYIQQLPTKMIGRPQNGRDR